MNPAVIDKKQTIPGGVGWGIERPQLIKDSKMITDDHQCINYPKGKDHLKVIDKNVTSRFTRFTGERAAQIDNRLGIDYDIYHQLNMQA